MRQVTGELEPAPGQHQYADTGQGEGDGIVLGDGLRQLQPVGRVEGKAEGCRNAEQHGRGERAYVRHPEQVAGAEVADLVDLAVLAAVEQLEAGLLLDQAVGRIVEAGQQLPSGLEQIVEHRLLGAIERHLVGGHQPLAHLARILEGILLGFVLVFGHAGVDDGGLQLVEREVGGQVGELAAQVLAVGVADLQPLQLLPHRIDQIVQGRQVLVDGPLIVLYPLYLIFQRTQLDGEGLVLLLLLQQQRHVGGELLAQPLAFGQRLLRLVAAQLVLLVEQAGLPLVFIRDGEIELLQLQLAEIVALLGGELLQLQHLDPVGETLLLEAGGQPLGILLAIRLAAEAEPVEQGTGLLQLLAQLVYPQVVLLARALQLVEAVHHRLTLLAQVELTVAAQADGLAQGFFFQRGEGRAGLGLVVVQALLEAGRLLGVINQDLLIGLGLLTIALGFPGKLQRLLITLPQFLVFRGVRLGDALQQLLYLGDGVIGLDEQGKEREGEQQQREQALQHGARFRS